MLESIPTAVFIGCILGFLAGLGVGGGSLLILWLTVVLTIPYPVARGINLLFFIPSALISAFFRWKQGAVKIKTLLPAVLCGCIASAAGSLIGLHTDLQILKKLFGGLLLITGIRELFYKPQKRKPEEP